MDTGDKQSRKSKLTWLVFLSIFIGFGVITSFVVWPQLSLKTTTDVIIVRAVDGPIKVRPLDQGGTKVKHQELLVIDMLKNGVAGTDNVETLLPALSSPEPPPIGGGKLVNSTDQASPKTTDLTATNGKTASPASEVGNAPTSHVITSMAEASKPEPKQKKTNTKEPFELTHGPAFVIQLAAFRNAEKAEEIANLLSEKHSSRLEGMRLQTMRFDTGVNGIFFRVVSPLLPRSQAEMACAKLRRAGQDCFLRKFDTPKG